MKFILGYVNAIRVENNPNGYNVVAIRENGGDGVIGKDIHAATLELAKDIKEKHEAEKLAAEIETLDGAVKYLREKTGHSVTISGHDEWPFEVAFRAICDARCADGTTAEDAIIKLAKKVMEDSK